MKIVKIEKVPGDISDYDITVIYHTGWISKFFNITPYEEVFRGSFTVFHSLTNGSRADDEFWLCDQLWLHKQMEKINNGN